MFKLKNIIRLILVLAIFILALFFGLNSDACEAQIDDVVFICSGEHENCIAVVRQVEGDLYYVETDTECFVVESKHVEVIEYAD